MDVDDPNAESSIDIKVPLSDKVRKNGTLYVAVFTTPATKTLKAKRDWLKMISGPSTTFNMAPLTQFHVPEAETFNLLGGEKVEVTSESTTSPVTHIRSKLIVSLMTDDIALPLNEALPQEIAYLMRRSPDKKHFLPIVYIDELSSRLRDLVKVNASDSEADVQIVYRPISYGKLRLFLQFSGALNNMHDLGFTNKDTDEVKGIFADTNPALLLLTFAVSAVHLLFDFLAFKNDISFWRGKRSMEGLSSSTVLWRAFSQTVIFLYLMDEETSLLVLVPSGIAAVIEMWKVTKIYQCESRSKTTEEFDSTAMKYLSYVLYPLCFAGAVYSLLYTPHKSWWSWTIQSTVNGVYAFGFLFMLPQLFVNYKLKSVAHLPWRAFTYKAFNTFIDDLFAFIITMPTAHRVACFRDDVVFLIYLYQRYLYPVDKSRVDTSTGMMEETEVSAKKKSD